MSRSALVVVFLVLTLPAMFGIIGFVVGDNASFTIQPLEEQVITLNLHETDSVSGDFSVVSNDDTGVNFLVADPYNNTVLKYDNVLHRDFSFTAKTDGKYELRFDNSLTTTGRKTVTVNYNITSYIMGMPQEQFLLIVIVAVALIGLILYVALMPK